MACLALQKNGRRLMKPTLASSHTPSASSSFKSKRARSTLENSLHASNAKLKKKAKKEARRKPKRRKATLKNNASENSKSKMSVEERRSGLRCHKRIETTGSLKTLFGLHSYVLRPTQKKQNYRGRSMPFLRSVWAAIMENGFTFTRHHQQMKNNWLNSVNLSLKLSQISMTSTLSSCAHGSIFQPSTPRTASK